MNCPVDWHATEHAFPEAPAAEDGDISIYETKQRIIQVAEDCDDVQKGEGSNPDLHH